MKIVQVLIIAIMFSFQVVSSSHAGMIEDQITFNSGSIDHTLKFLVDGRLSDTVGWSAFSLTSQHWSQAYIGPTWSPTPWISLGVSIGLQTVDDGNPIRYAGSLWAGNDMGSILAVYEHGANNDDWWWKAEPMINITPRLRLGVRLEKDQDIAPMLDISIKHNLSIWGTYRNNSSQIGLDFKF